MTEINSPVGSRVEMLINRVRKNRRKLKKWLAREKVTCYRLYDRDIPEIPMSIDWYDGRLQGAVYAGRREDFDAAAGRKMLQYLSEDLRLDPAVSSLKERVVGKGGSVYSPMDAKKDYFYVEEGGLSFWVNLTDYLDTGLFLDHRIARQMVRQEALGKRVLNLFAYTGAFSVYAASGGASFTTTVDLSNRYLEWARKNMELNGFTGEVHRYVRDDVLSALEGRTVEGSYDLAIIDPPTISRSKGMERALDVQRDHPLIINRVIERMTSRGIIYFSTNFTGFKMNEDALNCSSMEEISDRTVPPDFRNKKIHRCWRILV